MFFEPPLVEIADGDVVGPRLRDQLPLKNQFGANVIGDGGKIRGLHGKRNRGNGLVSGRRHDAIDGPVVRIRGRSAIAKDNQLAAAIDAFANRHGGVADLF